MTRAPVPTGPPYMRGPDDPGHPAGQLEAAFAALITSAGDDPARHGLADTPARAARAWRELTAGYQATQAPSLTTFPAAPNELDQIVAVAGIPFFSLCEHHLLPFFGHAHIAYLPGTRILGLSKFARAVDWHARRLQVQERLTNDVAEALTGTLDPHGLLVIIQAQHLCMAMRGVQRLGAVTTTSIARGVLLTKPEARAEALTLLDLGASP